MAFWDLTADDQNRLLELLKHREAHQKVDLPTPPELELDSIRGEFSLTPADMRAVLKGTWE